MFFLSRRRVGMHMALLNKRCYLSLFVCHSLYSVSSSSSLIVRFTNYYLSDFIFIENFLCSRSGFARNEDKQLIQPVLQPNSIWQFEAFKCYEIVIDEN